MTKNTYLQISKHDKNIGESSMFVATHYQSLKK
jgi:hypothetical protein